MIQPTFAELLRDRGIDQVISNNEEWAQRVDTFFREWVSGKPPGFEFIGETFRREAVAAGIPAPSHPNAWGGVFAGFVKTGLVRNTGRTEKMTDERSHARRSFVYTKS